MTTRRGTAVLVHGTWSSPADWRWVAPLLEAAGVDVVAVDLPSHRSPDDGLLADAEHVRAAIRAAGPPVVVVGWSYGTEVVSVAADGEDIARLVYVAAPPVDVRLEPWPTDWVDAVPLVDDLVDGTHVLDTDRWLDAEADRFAPDVLAHLREHRRRPASFRAATDPQPAAAWTSLPTTVLLGTSDELTDPDLLAPCGTVSTTCGGSTATTSSPSGSPVRSRTSSWRRCR